MLGNVSPEKDKFGCILILYINQEFLRRVYRDRKADPVCEDCV